jgi:hypothetical protein
MNPNAEPANTKHLGARIHRAASWLGILGLAAVLSACGGGAATETNPVTSSDGGINLSAYNGPNALTPDIRQFQINVWERLRANNRCGGCHVEGGQSPQFVRQDDVNLAYGDALPLVDLDAPGNSRLATKVGSGHNCWLSSNAACATLVTSYIEDWAAGVSGGAGRQIQLVAPAQVPPGSTLTFPSPPDYLDFDPIWTLLKDNCAGCHNEGAATPQSPFFASDTVADAFEAAKPKIDLNNPASSRLVVRLRSEFHNCWSDCDSDADAMQTAIENYAGTLSAATVEPPIVFSNAVRLVDGVVAAGGNRHEADVIALYEFKTGSGNIALDTSGVGAELNLTFSGDVNWVGGWGIEIVDGKAQGSTSTSKKLYDLITATGEYSIEAWAAPANVTQEGPARIVSYSGGTTTRNFTLGQTQYNYDFLHRSSTTDGNGEPQLSTADADEDLQATLQHVVVTFDPINGRRIYVNGEFTDDVDASPPGNLNDWDDSFALVLGNEVSGDRLWQGVIRMVAIHNRALTQEQIQQNFEVGVGEKFFLLFGISDLIGLPESFIMFEVSQFDSYSYLFNQPTFISLDPDVTPGGIPLEGMRIGINGKEASVGQAYTELVTTLNATDYDPATGQVLSEVGTIIALENGPDVDEFFLTFERLGGNIHVVTEPTNLTPADLPDPGEVPDIGVRTFDEINAAMSEMTGVSVADPGVQSTFNTVRQQLPSVADIETFLSAHQVGVAQLAIQYCDALVEDPALRTSFFTEAAGFGFNADVTTAFSGGEQVDIIDDLYNRMVGYTSSGGSELTTAPSRAQIQAELNNAADGNGDSLPDGLYDRLRQSCPPTCDAARTRTIVKAMCASVLGSAVMLVQ